MQLPFIAFALLVVGVAGQGGSFRSGTNNDASVSTATTTNALVQPTTATTPSRSSTLFLSTEPILVQFDGDAALSLKADIALRADQQSFGFTGLSGVATNVDPAEFFPAVPSGLGALKSMTVDFALTTTAPANGDKSPWDSDQLVLGKPGSVEVLVSSEYFNAIFGYNFDANERPEPKHNDDDGGDGHHGHPVHEFDAASIPAKLSFDKVTVAATDGTGDGGNGVLYLDNVVLTMRPRAEHVKRGLKRNLVFKLGDAGHPTIKIPTRTLTVPDGSIRPGKWLISPIHFPTWKWGRFELKRKICVQPVRVAQRRCQWRLPRWLGGFCFWWTNTSISGRGLAFGQPSANAQWAKVDITFDWQPWKTVIDRTGEYEVLTSGQEETDLKNEVDDDDCIEVFFVEKFSPASRMGGGACWGGGTAGTKIISSDENVDCGTDITHLAHELGHALNLKHPGSGSSTRPDGSTGTLLCPSGWEQDNPRRQSRENGDNASNPLLTSYLSFTGWWTSGGSPECADSADCGSCNAHLPNEPCV